MDDEQLSFAAAVPFERYAKTTKRSVFLDEMDRIIPWDALCDVVRPHYPTGLVGRVPVPLERMLRIHFLQNWFSMSDPGAEEALHDSISMRTFAGIDLGRARVPDETTICKFRHLLEKHKLGEQLFRTVNAHLKKNGVRVATGTIVDATIIAAPSSTKNASGERDPEMHQTKKGNQWFFGMKLHIGVDSKEHVVHSLSATPANVHDSKELPALLHGRERRVYGDSAYRGQVEVIRERAKHAHDFTNRRNYRNRSLSDADLATNRRKSKVRAYVEHIFGIVKVRFGFQKVRYRGIAKNLNKLNVLVALANLVVCKRRLLRFA